MTGHRLAIVHGHELATADSPRATRILDAMRELVLRMGYRKVNVQDVAEAAGVGKGSIYLHWNSKDDILDDVLLREARQVSGAYIQRVRRDPRLVTLGCTGEQLYLGAMANPILRGYNMGNAGLLGSRVAVAGMPDRLGISLVAMLTDEEYLGLLCRQGLLLDDVSSLGGRLSIAAVTGGFVMRRAGRREDQANEGCARLLAAVLHRSFEPNVPPTRAQLTSAVVELLADKPQRLSGHLRPAPAEPQAMEL
jgi:AcrR family transcriptional regulator